MTHSFRQEKKKERERVESEIDFLFTFFSLGFLSSLAPPHTLHRL